MHLRPNNPALAEARTAFPLKVRQVHEMKRLLQPAGQNNKIGKGDSVIKKGKWRGMPCFTLTLEERATCPSDCKQWAACYGNNMRFAYRVDHRDPNELTRKLAAELKDLLRTYRAIVVRPTSWATSSRWTMWRSGPSSWPYTQACTSSASPTGPGIARSASSCKR